MVQTTQIDLCQITVQEIFANSVDYYFVL